MASYSDIYIDQGADFTLAINLQDDTTHAYINVLSYIISGQLRTSFQSTNIAATFSCSTGNTSNGQIMCTLSANQTANLISSAYLFDITAFHGANVTNRLMQGRAFVNPSVTK